ncbi:superoxide dismutase family protein [Aurantimonas marina]|uniref:superoxide dismutase family protein n=1 Tax=Aurantimonas marina TaxID=2780508 RepID=UPI0019D1DB7D|nr:superoxide dismutase family protein [Aurantimonas marina]
MRFITTTLAVALLAAPAFAQDSSGTAPMTVELNGPDGASLGTVEVTSTPLGILLNAELSGLSDGQHGFHIHETGVCEGDFKSAGGHYNPGEADHGYLSGNGPHAGDMPNFTVTGGAAKFETFNAMVAVEGGEAPLADEEGSALIVHGGADDYISQPSGDAGDRVACGVIAPPK